MRLTDWLNAELSPRARLAVLGAGLLLAGTVVFPLWQMTMFAGQFPEGLRLSIFSWKIVGGNNGADLQGINILNHYIGMREIRAADFVEMRFIPFTFGVFVLLGARAALFARVRDLIDLTVLFTYFGAFSFGTFVYRMYTYGHELAAEAPIKVAAFTPPILGHQHIANFDVYSFPAAGTYFVAVYGAVLLAVLLLEARRHAVFAR
jgi:hypothetical protein